MYLFPFLLVQVTEDLKLVAHIKDLFNTLQNIAENPSLFTLRGDFLSPSSSSTLLGDVTVSSDITDNPLNTVKQEMLMKKDLMVPDVGQITGNKSSTHSTQASSHFMVQDKFQDSQKTKQHLLGGHTMDGSVSDTMYGLLSAKLTEPLYAQSQFMCADPGFASLEEELHFSSQYTAVNRRQSPKQSTMLNYCDKNVEKNNHNIDMNSSAAYGFYFGDMVDEQFEFAAAEEISHEIAVGFLNFPAASELHKALWPAFGEHRLSDPPLSEGYDRWNGLSLIDQSNLTGANETSFGESIEWFVKGVPGEHLLDAVVNKACGTSEECAFDTFNNITSPSSSSGQLATSCQTQCRSSGGVLVDDTGPLIYAKSASAARSGNLFTSSPSASSSRATSILVDEALPKIELEDARSRKVAKSYQVGKRKPRTSGDVQKRRPRDRQMIQDRVKELREIVPHGSKVSCSFRLFSCVHALIHELRLDP